MKTIITIAAAVAAVALVTLQPITAQAESAPCVLSNSNTCESSTGQRLDTDTCEWVEVITDWTFLAADDLEPEQWVEGGVSEIRYPADPEDCPPSAETADPEAVVEEVPAETVPDPDPSPEQEVVDLKIGLVVAAKVGL